jgi:predicted nucleotidyltransferase
MAVTQEMLEKLRETLVKEIAPKQIYLFGSQAHGSAGPDSDIDLLVVERDAFGTTRSRRQELARIRRALAAFRVPKDILVYSREEMLKWQHAVNHIIARCVREGKLLYERPCACSSDARDGWEGSHGPTGHAGCANIR